MSRTLRTPVHSRAEALQTAVNCGSQPFTEVVLRALSRLRVSEKELAAAMKLSPSQWSQQKARSNHHHISVQRVDVLPEQLLDRFLDNLLEELASMRGKVIATPQGHLRHFAAAMGHMSEALKHLSASTPIAPAVDLPLLEASDDRR